MLEGTFDGTKLNIGIVVSRFNEFSSKELLNGAIECLNNNGVYDDSIDVVWVPGSFELPLIAKKLAQSNRYNVVIALGAVIRGNTPHFDYVADAAAQGIARASYDTGIPVIFGVLTTDTVEQAIERSQSTKNNKGWEAALAAIEMANVLQSLDEKHFSKSKKTRAGFR